MKGALLAAALHAVPAAPAPAAMDQAEIMIDGHIQKPRTTDVA